ncbi:MAG: L,D-transpeptidase family protein [Hyphomicrobium sp.]
MAVAAPIGLAEAQYWDEPIQPKKKPRAKAKPAAAKPVTPSIRDAADTASKDAAKEKAPATAPASVPHTPTPLVGNEPAKTEPAKDVTKADPAPAPAAPSAPATAAPPSAAPATASTAPAGDAPVTPVTPAPATEAAASSSNTATPAAPVASSSEASSATATPAAVAPAAAIVPAVVAPVAISPPAATPPAAAATPPPPAAASSDSSDSAAEDARAAAREAKSAAEEAEDAAALAKATTPAKPVELVIPTTARPDADPVVAVTFARLGDKQFTGNAHKDDVAAALAFYGNRSGTGLWTAADGLNAKAKAVVAEFGKAGDWGLASKDFDIPQLTAGQTTPDGLGDAEARLTLSALKYARFAKGGRIDPQSLSRIWDQVAPIKDPSAVLDAMATREEADSYLRHLHPQHEQFNRLRKALLDIRGPAEPEAPIDPVLLVKLPKGSSLKPGADHADVVLLRQRLKVPAEAGAKDTLYDPKLVDAVKSYQKDKGLEAGGWLNQATRNALNTEGEAKKPNAGRDEQRIVLNMERWRWMPENMGAFHVWDNIPEYMVRVIRDGREIHRDKIIVGQTSWPTPVFSADMLYVIFNPEWGMPNGIKMKELKPRLQASGGGFFDTLFGGGGGSVIRAYGLRVSYNGRVIDPDSVDWSNANLANYSFVQPAGAKNPLGVVKFRFPNKHDVYMHDTPERELFGRSTRALSHGCIRVNNPLRFAELLLEHDGSSGRGHVNLKTPIPVHISYFTAIVEDDGKISTFGDIYGHDTRLSAALGGKPIYFEPPADVETSSTVATSEDGAAAPRPGAAKKKKKNETFEDIIQNVFLN